MTVADNGAPDGARPRPPDVIGPWEPDAWYRLDVVCRALGIARQTLLNNRSDGDPTPTATRVGRLLYFRGSDITAYLESRREAAR